MILEKIKSTKDNVDTPWSPGMDTSVVMRLFSHYNNKLLASRMIFSANLLEKTVTTVYANQAVYDEYWSDPILSSWQNNWRTFCQTHNIVVESTIVDTDTLNESDPLMIEVNGILGMFDFVYPDGSTAQFNDVALSVISTT